MPEIKIVVATHVDCGNSWEAPYIPLWMGAALKKKEAPPEGYASDNTGENISKKNKNYCELTGLYWAWKNLEADYIGLVHYRRLFAEGHRVMEEKDYERYIPLYRILLPRKRRYYIETLYSHYAHTHYQEHLDIAREIISQKYPEYLGSYDKAVKRRSGYMFNMMVMERALLEDYCGWLFDVLGELEKSIDLKGLSSYQARLFGRLSEILFNVWLIRRIEEGALEPEDIAELKVLYRGKVDYLRKIISFLRAKFLHEKYTGGF